MDQQQLFTLSNNAANARGLAGALCAHPAAAHIVTGNLFTGAQDKVCADCGATLAPEWKPAERG